MNTSIPAHSAWREWRATGGQQQRVGYWRDTICQAVLDVDMVKGQMDGSQLFCGSLKSLDHQGARLVSFQSSSHGVVRTARQADRADSGHLMVSLQLAGVSRITQQNNEVVLRPGDIGIIDTGRPFELWFPHYVERRIVLLPKQLLAADPVRCPGLKGALHIRRSFPLSPVLASFLKTATRPDHELAPGHMQLLLEGLADYLHESVHEIPVVPEKTAGQPYHDALDYIAANIRDPDLSIAGVAQAVGVSIRTLHRLFQRFSDSSCEKFIFDQRLELAYAELTSLRHATVAEAAFAAGFSDQAHFTRRFRDRYQIVPSSLL